MKQYNFIAPCEANNYCLFDKELEENPNIVFHTTRIEKFNSILEKGFLSAKELGIETDVQLESVSYAKSSSGCIAHRGSTQDVDYVVIIVKFEDINDSRIANNGDVIHIYHKELQPEIVGYTIIPKEYKLR